LPMQGVKVWIRFQILLPGDDNALDKIGNFLTRP
jgi:hypothetical protein